MADTCSAPQKIDVKALRGILFKAAADAGKALRLSPVEQAALSALIVCINVSSIRDQTIGVSPSAQQLEDLTGFSASSLSAALKSLSEHHLIRRVASRANRRFEVECSEIGQRAFYGFDLAPLQAQADQLRAGARRIDSERRWLRELRHQILCLSAEVRKGLDILLGQAGPEKAGAVTPWVDEYEALLKKGASRSLPLDQAQTLVDAWSDFAARMNGHRSTAAERAEGMTGEPLPSSAAEAAESVLMDGRCENKSVDEVSILALVNGNLPVVAETIGQPVAELKDLTESAPVLALMTGIGLETWVKVQREHGPVIGALVLSYFAQIQGEDATSGRWKIKSPKAYLLSLSERVRQSDDIISWIEGLHRRPRH
ncbi:helix-turn-helix domain-containing protein [Microvirga tunisiensis]|uniref:helix-turn-helix domain-containing protein n=1 Tax=Microvirga tunisiensis TaxID=2108360 RepID=UPI0013866282